MLASGSRAFRPIIIGYVLGTFSLGLVPLHFMVEGIASSWLCYASAFIFVLAFAAWRRHRQEHWEVPMALVVVGLVLNMLCSHL